MIGFKTQTTQVQQLQQAQNPVMQEIPQIDDLVKMKGLQQAQTILLEYMSDYSYPLLQGEERDKFFMNRLRKVKERYFEPI